MSKRYKLSLSFKYKDILLNMSVHLIAKLDNLKYYDRNGILYKLYYNCLNFITSTL